MTDLQECEKHEKNLYLVGFMGTGKTTAGRRVASRLNMRFLDVDCEIERKEGVSINQIFEKKGENAFRRMERNFIESEHPRSGCVVSCGGGLVVPEGMPELLRSRGVVVCLWATPDTILARTKENSSRPLLEAPDPLRRIQKLLDQREPRYLKAGNLVSTTDRSLDEVVEAVLRLYKSSAIRAVDANS